MTTYNLACTFVICTEICRLIGLDSGTNPLRADDIRAGLVMVLHSDRSGLSIEVA